MQKEEKFVGSLANRTQADNDEKAESGGSENSNLYELHLESSWPQAKEEWTSERRRVFWQDALTI